MRAKPIEIRWHSRLPVFASEPFLQAVGDEYGWLGGVDQTGHVLCVLPYTIIRKAVFRMVRFRVETIPVAGDSAVEEEREFLDSVVVYFRSVGADVIIPSTTNAVFRTYPTGADAAPYGSYIIDLTPGEETVWRNIGRITRQNIKTAQKDGVVVRTGTIEDLPAAYQLTKDTFKRSELPFMDFDSYKRYTLGLGANGKLMLAEYQGALESCVMYAFSDYCAYAVYAGNRPGQHQGANKLIYWEGMRQFREMGIPTFDFVGARINPEKGSKQEALNLFKQRFGAELKRGFLWKFSLRPVRSLAYKMMVRLLRGGDIVDRERYKLGVPTTDAMQHVRDCVDKT